MNFDNKVYKVSNCKPDLNLDDAVQFAADKISASRYRNPQYIYKLVKVVKPKTEELDIIEVTEE